MNQLERMKLILQASKDPAFFNSHPYFCGHDLYPKLNAIMREFYQVDDSGVPLQNELIFIAGKKSGKTTLSGRICAYELFDLLIKPDPAAYYNLEPGDEIFILGIAKSEDQARDTIFSKIRNPILRSPFFREFKPKVYSLEIRFPTKHVTVMCGCSASDSVTGRLVKAIAFDELSGFDETQSQRGAWRVYSMLSKDTQPFGFKGKRIVTTSPRHQNDIGMQLLDRAKTHARMKWIHEPTWKISTNPIYAYNSPEMKSEREKDPLTFWRDYGAQPWSSLEVFYREPDIIQFDERLPNALQMYFRDGTLMPKGPFAYVFTGDPAKKFDAFGFCLAHLEYDGRKRPGEPMGIVVIDGIYKMQPTKKRELNPIEVKNKMLGIIRHYPVRQAVFDTWNYPEAQEEIRQLGIPVQNHLVMAEDHTKVKNRFYFKKIRVCKYTPLRKELEQLKIVNAKRVDHPKGGSKDVADAVANAVWALEEGIISKPIAFNIVQSF